MNNHIVTRDKAIRQQKKKERSVEYSFSWPGKQQKSKQNRVNTPAAPGALFYCFRSASYSLKSQVMHDAYSTGTHLLCGSE